MNAQRADSSFREFVVGFSDPLARLAFLLTAGTSTGGPGDSVIGDSVTGDSVAADSVTAHSMTIDALARVQRHWHDAGTTGAPEPVAVDALVAALPRLRKRAVTSAIEVAAPVSVAPAGVSTVVDDDIEVLRAALWRAWTTLAPRQRVPLLFLDASVASRRLAGLDVPESFGRTRSRDALAAGAMRDINLAMLADPSIRAASRGDGPLMELLLDVLREHASTTATPIDPYPWVTSRVRQVRTRAVMAVGVVVLVLAATTVIAVNVSKPAKAPAVVAIAGHSAPFLPVPAPRAVVPVALANGVVNWPARGTAADNAVLLAQLKDSFVHAHPDATGTVQVLLATDTSAFRVAYVTANSPKGVIQSWFYGAVGSTDLVEGEASYGGALVADASVLASAVIDGQGQGQLVVIAPPTTRDMQLADFDFSKPAGPGFQPLAYQNGVAVKPIDIDSVSALILRVQVGANTLQTQNLPIVTLGPPVANVGSASFEPASPGPAVPVERGRPDQQVLAQLVRAATVWHNQDAPGTPMELSVLWGGTDEAGTHLVVGRLKMRVFDVLLLQWNNDAPGAGGEYPIAKDLPDTPLAFAYRGLDGTRIGVLASPGVNGSTFGVVSALAMPGQPAWAAQFDSTGFASIALPQANRLIDLTLNVDLLDKAGHLVEVIPMPPSA